MRRTAPRGLGRLLVPALLACLGLQPARAGVLITSQEADQGRSEVAISGDWARIDHDGWPIYMLIDMGNRHVYAVSPQDHQIVDLTTPPPPPSQHAAEAIAKVGQPKATVEKVGDGPVIAGYRTTRYRVSVDGHYCYDEYLALAPLEDPQIRRFVRALSLASQTEPGTALEIAIDPSRICQAADNLVDDQYSTLGIPMRTVSPDQTVIHRITAIRHIGEFEPDFFELPADYPRLSRRQAQEQAQARLDPNDPQVIAREHAIERIIEGHGQPDGLPPPADGHARPAPTTEEPPLP